ncbi:methyl-accepting chemotaxis protein [Thermocoleostomius sinensis]|uniref:Methyl-accepting chemotaxis protein n=1 Tax=Thermocoleostomius sinensis A174 TaxID=2016057 RepID=A0A9E8ZGE4_9CYAN|nr:methyl-accepting chemotaxis protein [Thermocoleostomius sinensis]WAL62668.1 methyl-accepting chemotaxis protein [Thermocoleostomius sinensis A174]
MNPYYPSAQPDEDLFSEFDGVAFVSAEIGPSCLQTTNSSSSFQSSDVVGEEVELIQGRHHQTPDHQSWKRARVIDTVRQAELGNSPDAQKFATAMLGLRTELEKAGLLNQPGLQTRLQQIGQLFQTTHDGIEDLIEMGVQQQLQTMRQQGRAVGQALRQAGDVESLYQVAVTWLQHGLRSDRVLLLQWVNHSQLKILADTAQESRSLQGTFVVAEDLEFALCVDPDYQASPVIINHQNFDSSRQRSWCEQLLERLQMTTGLALPIWVNGQAWGGLVAFQVDDRHWQEADTDLLWHMGTELALRLQQLQADAQLTKVAERERTVVRAIANLGQRLDWHTQEIRSLMNSMRTIAVDAQQLTTAIQTTTAIVQQGHTTANKMTNRMLNIRNTISDSNKKIKRLYELSQKFSEAANLIRPFTAQTQLLALNAAIEVTRAGEAERGFAVVADEIQTLARRSAESTTEIETLVQNIQTQIHAVIIATNASIDQIMHGTNVVNEMYHSVNEIANAIAKVNHLVQSITHSLQGIVEISTEPVAECSVSQTASVSTLFQTLLATIEALQTSLNQFTVE